MNEFEFSLHEQLQSFQQSQISEESCFQKRNEVGFQDFLSQLNQSDYMEYNENESYGICIKEDVWK